MVELKKVTEHREIIEICGKCGDCGTTGTQISTAKRHIDQPCVVKNVLGFEAYDARGRILVLKNLLEGNISLDDSIVKWAYTCTTCGSCKETCLAIEGGIDTPLLMESLREDLVRLGYKMEKHGELAKSIQEYQNPYNEPKEERLQFLKIDPEHVNTEGEIHLYIGCTSSYREQQIAQATIDLFELLGIDFFILKNEDCCGSILKRQGYIRQFDSIVKKNIETIRETGAKKMVFPCAGCYRTFKQDYSLDGMEHKSGKLKLYHLVEFLDEYLAENPYQFKFKRHQKITYHDPCHLGRHSGVYEAPRNLLRMIENATFVEMTTSRNYGHCCGAGGGVKSSNNDLAISVANNRWDEVLDRQATILVSACPFCEKNFKDALPDGQNGLRVLDISEILLETAVRTLSSQVITNNKNESLTIGKRYMNFLSEYPEIFSDLTENSIMDFTIYESIDDLEDELVPHDAFNVKRTADGIKIVHGRADDPDLELALSIGAVKKLVNTTTKEEYATLFGSFYNEPDEDEGWIDFVLHKRTKSLIKMGYGKFAESAGILEDENQV